MELKLYRPQFHYFFQRREVVLQLSICMFVCLSVNISHFQTKRGQIHPWSVQLKGHVLFPGEIIYLYIHKLN